MEVAMKTYAPEMRRDVPQLPTVAKVGGARSASWSMNRGSEEPSGSFAKAVRSLPVGLGGALAGMRLHRFAESRDMPGQTDPGVERRDCTVVAQH
jgi:hypothetical protein